MFLLWLLRAVGVGLERFLGLKARRGRVHALAAAAPRKPFGVPEENVFIEDLIVQEDDSSFVQMQKGKSALSWSPWSEDFILAEDCRQKPQEETLPFLLPSHHLAISPFPLPSLNPTLPLIKRSA